MRPVVKHPPAIAQLDAEALVRRSVQAGSIVDLIGGTPLIRLRNLEPRPGVEI